MGVEARPSLLRRRDVAQAIGKKAQAPLGRDGRVQLAHATGRRIAWVDKGFFAFGTLRNLFALLFIQGFKIGAAHIDLAAHFQHGRRIRRQPERYLVNGADVLRHVFAHLAIAPRGGLHQHAVLITQAHGQAVELEFGDIFDRWIGRR